MNTKQKQKGFTLIELLVVIAIIGLLASVVLVALNGARFKARTAKRLADLNQLTKALELYYSDNNAYPPSSGGWGGYQTCWGTASTTGWIVGLVPQYVSQLPHDPNMQGCGSDTYIYSSNGTDYKLIDHNPEDMTDVMAKYPNLIDPTRPTWAYGFWTPGYAGN